MSTANFIKHRIKRGLQFAAANLGPHTRNSKEPQLVILMYHRILPRDDERVKLEEPGMVVSPRSFEAHLRTLSEYFEFVTLSDWLERRAKGLHVPAKACAITFDDGWADNFEFAFPILQTLQVPATIFLVAEMVDTIRMFWPERLARIVNHISSQSSQKWAEPATNWLKQAATDFAFEQALPTIEQITQLVAYAKQFTDEEVYNYLDKIEESLELEVKPTIPSLLDWTQVLTMINSGLIEVGSHTCTHVRMNKVVPSTVVEYEIETSKHLIEQKTGQQVKLFCFPNGDYSDTTLNLVKKNYQGAVTTASGWNSITTDKYLLKRIGVHEDITADRTAFLARISGWL